MAESAGIALLAAVFVAWVHLRHWGLAVLIAGMPALGVTGVCWAFWPWTPNPLDAAMATLFGAACAQLLADEIALRIGGGDAPRDAVRGGWNALALPLLALTVALLLVPVGFHRWQAGAMLAAPALLALAAMRATFLLPLDEEWIARASRFREWAERRAGFLVPAARPRWGFSVAGIALVFTVLAAFGAQPFLAPDPVMRKFFVLAAFYAGAFVLVATCLALLLRDWRATLAALLAVTPVVTTALWLCVRFGQWQAEGQIVCFTALATGLAPLLVAVRACGLYLREGDDGTMAGARMLSRHAVGIGLTALAASLGWLLALPLIPEIAAPILGTQLLAAAAALAFFPAFMAVIETLAPRRETLEARYRIP